MATADQVKALIRSHAEGDDGQFYSVAMQVAARASRGGQGRFAQELRELIDQVRKRAPSHRDRVVAVARPRGELAGLLSASYPKTSMADMVLEPPVHEQLDRVVLEQRQQDRLHAHGFTPLRQLLLIGPPGTGKTMTASALAGELHLPLFSIRLDGLITKFLGETAAKLRLVFDAMQETRGIYLFDEVDALGGAREQSNDIGEIRRVLNSFLQFLEQDQSDSMLLAATNHPQLLDRALFRRFDSVIEYPLPSAEIIHAIIRNRLAAIRLAPIRWKAVADVAAGLSHAEVTLAAERAAKDTILASTDAVTTPMLVAALQERQHESDR
jgi:SpoVK/Ycf46/Vps4 family AAA+-type ATPase